MRGGWLKTLQWWAGQDSNLQPDRYERPALTIELPARLGARREGVKRKKRAVAIMRSRRPAPLAVAQFFRAISCENQNSCYNLALADRVGVLRGAGREKGDRNFFYFFSRN